VADVFDALLSVRPYKRRWSCEEAVNYNKTQAGRHFDPRLVDLFVANLEEILAIRSRFPDEPAAAALDASTLRVPVPVVSQIGEGA
ncbi:MAG: hypothetical protein N2483_08280, partial [Burkholderiaceae bacterium]|nr:hypothetical protein [Burkholderiaceae bacterium]